MTDQQEQLETLREIRTLMAKSTRFLSLSGLSGVFAGIFALAGATFAWYHLNLSFGEPLHLKALTPDGRLNLEFVKFVFLDAGVVLALSLASGYFFTLRNARKEGVKMVGPTAMRMLINLFLPLVAGGIFCLFLLYWGDFYLVPGATLIFYGLALLNASKYTLNDIRYLGVSEIVLGLIGCYFIQYSLLIWALGFGVLHVVYGAVMYFKYER